MFRICSFSEEFLFYNFIINLEVYVYSVWSCLNISSSFIAGYKERGLCKKKRQLSYYVKYGKKRILDLVFFSYDFALGFPFTTLLRNFGERKRKSLLLLRYIFAGKNSTLRYSAFALFSFAQFCETNSH